MGNELTDFEKAKVFSMYIGHIFKIESEHFPPPEKWTYTVSGNTISNIASGTSMTGVRKLLLTPLDKISNEDLTAISKMWGYSIPSYVYGGWLITKELYLQHWQILEYLKSKGVAVPLWFGINHWANGKTAIELGIGISKQ